jgi:hypothetical protein
VAFDQSRVPGGDVGVFGERCRRDALGALAKQEWAGVYECTKSWVGWGGGAWLPDAWILYAASALLKGEPRGAVNSLDLGLRVWIVGPQDRRALVWLRGMVIWRRLNDPKTALLDLDVQAPAWLAPDPADLVARCAEAAARSRKRVPSVKPRPALSTPDWAYASVAPAVGRRQDGDIPSVWEQVEPLFNQDPPAPSSLRGEGA